MDPSREILSSAMFALQQMGRSKPSTEELMPFLTTPLLRCFEEHFGLTRQEANHAFQHFWHYAGSFGLRKNVWYEGVPEMLDQLLTRGHTLHIATAREISQVKFFLNYKKMTHVFSVMVGPSTNPYKIRRTKKIILFDTITKIIESRLGDCVAENCVMIGDRESDISAAKINKISSIGVTYGQDSTETIVNSNPDYIVHSSQELSDFLLSD